MRRRQRTDAIIRRCIADGWQLPEDVPAAVAAHDKIDEIRRAIDVAEPPTDADLGGRLQDGEPWQDVMAEAEAAELAAQRARRARDLLSSRRFAVRGYLAERLLVDHADALTAEANRRVSGLLGDLADAATELEPFASTYDLHTILAEGTKSQRAAAAKIAEATGSLHHALDLYDDVVRTCAQSTKHDAPAALSVAVKPLSGVTVFEDGGPEAMHGTDVRDMPTAALVAAAAHHTVRLLPVDDLAKLLRHSNKSPSVLDLPGDPRMSVGDMISISLPTDPNVDRADADALTAEEADKLAEKVEARR